MLTTVLLSCARSPAAVDTRDESPIKQAHARAETPGRAQTLARLELASLALAEGDTKLSESALRPAVIAMQDFKADGQFAAVVGAEDRKEWKGEPYEKMAAFWTLGVLLHARGDHGNALAMSKSALLADTGTRSEQFQADFVPAYVLKALAHQSVGEDHNASRAIDDAVHAWTTRRMIEVLTKRLQKVEHGPNDRTVVAAKALLLSGLPAAMDQHPRSPIDSVRAALSYATDLRQFSLDARRRHRPAALAKMSKADIRRAFEHLEPITQAWADATTTLPPDLLADVDADAEGLKALLEEPSLVIFVARGRGPRKIGSGRYGELLQLEPLPKRPPPRVELGGTPIRPQLLDSLAWQATTRGGRNVDGFLAGKAVFKDASIGIGYSMMVAGDLAAASDAPELAAAVYIAGALTWIAGVVTNPTADVRTWNDAPDDIYVLVADPPPGTHTLQIDDRTYSVDIPDTGTVAHLIPNTAPWGARHFGTPCIKCEAPLPLPEGQVP